MLNLFSHLKKFRRALPWLMAMGLVSCHGAGGGSGGSIGSAFAPTRNIAGAHLAFTVQPTNTLVGTSISPSVVVTSYDADGNLAATFTGLVTLAIGTNPSSGTLSGTTTVAAVNGVATFAGLSIGTVGTGYSLNASTSGLLTANSANFNITPGSATQIKFSTQPSNALAGASISPAIVVTAYDSNLNVDTSYTGNVTLAIGANPGTSTLSGTITKAAVSGVATFSNISLNKTGTAYTLTAASGALTGDTSSTFNITPGSATQVKFMTQPSSAVAGASIAPAIVVTAYDSNLNIDTNYVANVTLAIGTNPGTSTLSGTTTKSAVAGVTTFSNISLNKTGTAYTLTAASGALTSDTSSTFNITPGSATRVKFMTQPSNAIAGASISPAIVVTAYDSNLNIDTNYVANVTLAIGANPGTSTLSGTATKAAVAGVATFSNINLNKTGTAYTLTAASGALTGDTSSTFNITPASATQVKFTTQPSNAIAGASISPAIVVTAYDSNLNIDTNYVANVTLAIGTNPGTSTLSGTATKAAVAGITTFSNISLSKTGTAYTLTAASGALTGDTSSTFNITPGSATRVKFMTQPSNAIAGASISPAIVVTAYDSNLNIDTNYVANVTLAIGANPGTSTLSGTATKAAVAGVATFSNINLNKTGTAYTLTAASGALTGDTSSTFNISPNIAAVLAFTSQPTNTGIPNAISPAPAVTAYDSYGNLVSGYSGSVTMAIGTNPASGTLSGTIPINALTGVATFSDLKINNAGTGYTLLATATGLSSATSSTFNIIGPPTTPASVTATAGITNVLLSWTASTGTGPITYTIKRGTVNGGPYTTVGSSSSTTFTDTTGNGIAAGTQYYYVIVASNVGGNSSNSSQVTGIPIGSFNLSSAVGGNKQVVVTWGAATGATAYTVEYGTTTGTYPNIWSATATSPTTVTGLTNGSTYYFRIKATNATGSGLSNAESSASPAGPSNFQISSASPGSTSVTLTWTNSTGATTYAVKYGTATGVYGTTASNNATSPYTVTGLTSGTLYYFMVTATGGGSTINADQEANARPGTVWSIYGAPNIPKTYLRSQLALDTTTTPNGLVVGGQDSTNNKALAYKYSAGNWNLVSGANANASTIQLPATAVAPSGPANAGYVYLSYSDAGGTTANGLTVRFWNGTTWANLGGTAGFTAAMDYSSIAADASGNIWVAYRRTSDSHIMVVEYSAGAWGASTDVSAAGGYYTFSFAFDKTTSPYTPYLAWSALTNTGFVMKYSAGAWSQLGATLPVGQYSQLSIDVDSTGVPYVGYADRTASYKGTVKKYTAGAWTTVGAAAFTDGQAAMATVAIDQSNNTPYLAYFDEAHQNRVSVQKFSAGAWSVVGQSGFSDMAAASPNTNAYRTLFLVIDAASTLYVAFANTSDFSTNGDVSVYSFNSTRDFGPVGLGWTNTYPTSSTNLTASWTPSSNGNATDQKIQFYRDEFCNYLSGGLIDLGSAVTATRAFTGAAGNSYSYRIGTFYSNQDPVWSNCSLPMTVTSAFTLGADYAQPVGVGALTGNELPKIVLDKLDRPFVAWLDTNTASQNSTSVAMFSNGSWNYIGQNVCPGCYATSWIALDNSGSPWIAGYGTKGSVYSYSFGSGTWTVAGATNFTPNVADIKIAINSQTNYPYVAFIDYTTPSHPKLGVESWNGSAWSYVGAGTITANDIYARAGDIALATDSNGVPYVAYVDTINNNQIFVMSYTAGAWSYVGTSSTVGISSGSTAPSFMSMFIDPTTNYPVIAYQDASVGYKDTVQRYNGSSWSVVGSAGMTSSGAAIAGLDVTVDSSGNIWLVDGYTGKILEYTSSWNTINSITFDNYVRPTIATDSTGNPWISWASNLKSSSIFAKHWTP